MIWRFKRPDFLPSRVGLSAMNILIMGFLVLLAAHYLFQVTLSTDSDLPKAYGYGFLPIGVYLFCIVCTMWYLSWAKKRRSLSRPGEFLYSYVFGDDVEHAVFREKYGDAPFDIREFESNYKVSNPVLSDVAQIDILTELHKSSFVAANTARRMSQRGRAVQAGKTAGGAQRAGRAHLPPRYTARPGPVSRARRAGRTSADAVLPDRIRHQRGTAGGAATAREDRARAPAAHRRQLQGTET